MTPDSRPIPPLNLKRRFALTSLAVIVIIALGLGWLLSNMLTQRMLQREGEVTMDFVQNLLSTDQSGGFFLKPQCRRRLNFDHPCRLNIDQGLVPTF